MEKVFNFIMSVITIYIVICAVKGLANLLCELKKILFEISTNKSEEK